MKLSDGEKLIIVMLSDLMMSSGNDFTEVDPEFIKEAIAGGHSWAIKWQYPGLFHEDETSEGVVRETSNILSMCSFLEFSIGELSETDRDSIPAHDQQVFRGFDANNEPHYGVARMLVEQMGRWPELQNRAMNSHMQIIDKYRRMKEAYDGNGGPRTGGIPVDELRAILAA